MKHKNLYIVPNNSVKINEATSDDNVGLEFEADQGDEDCNEVLQKMEKEIISSKETRTIVFVGFVGVFLAAVSIFFAIILI